jgi:NAD(P)-dependent dehydrogenase (short-subunit alcohol dehydrogenase family)
MGADRTAADRYASVSYRSLVGKPVVITGGASGIGAEMVRAFAAQGAKVAFLDIDEKAGAAVAAETGGTFHACDVTDIARLREVLADIETATGGVEILINNAARDDRHEMATVEPDYWHRALAVNLDHQFFATQAVAKGMIARGRGSIILFSSISWLRARPGMVAYTTAKAAIFGLTKTMSRELGPSGIRVNCIVPGAILTERQAKLWRTPEVNNMIMNGQAMKVSLDATHVARMALFVSSDECAGCTGTSFLVDAGLTQS